VDPKLPCLIAAGGNDASTIGVATDDKRLATEFWLIPLLDRCKEGIHVHVDDLAEIGAALWWAGQSINSSPDLLSLPEAIQRWGCPLEVPLSGRSAGSQCYLPSVRGKR